MLWKYVKCKRSSVKRIRNTPTPSGRWHEPSLKMVGRTVLCFLDGKGYPEHDLPDGVSGRVGLWPRADSVVYFDDFVVEPLIR